MLHRTPPRAKRLSKHLDLFEDYFGNAPVSMASHYNADAMYWGPARLSGWRRGIYNLITLGRSRGRFFGHVEGHPSFWGDVCRERIRYCRNFVYADINTLRMNPWMPYTDPLRPYVRYWYSSSEGNQAPAFLNTLQDANQDRLEATSWRVHHVHSLRSRVCAGWETQSGVPANDGTAGAQEWVVRAGLRATGFSLEDKRPYDAHRRP